MAAAVGQTEIIFGGRSAQGREAANGIIARTSSRVSATTGVEYPAELFSVSIAGPGFIVPLNVPTNGLFDIMVVNGAFTVYNTTEVRRNAISLAYPASVSINIAGLPSKLARGSEFTVRGTLLSNVSTAYLYVNSVYTPIEVVSTAVDRVVLRIPAGMALGTYARVRVVTSDAITRTMTRSITVTE